MSGDEGLPPTSGQVASTSDHTSRSSSPTTTSSSMTSSPRPSRKRTNDQIYSSKDASTAERPRTAPEQGQQTAQSMQFQQQGFSKTLTPASKSFGSTIATLSTQPSNAFTTITASDAPNTLVGQIQELQAELSEDYEAYVAELENRDHKEHLDTFYWDELERQYLEEMEPAIRGEQAIGMQLANRYKNMLLWMQTSSDREAERAVKRLRTRIAFVQNSEAKLTQKEAHYQKVLNAFQSTMALFGGI